MWRNAVLLWGPYILPPVLSSQNGPLQKWVGGTKKKIIQPHPAATIYHQQGPFEQAGREREERRVGGRKYSSGKLARKAHFAQSVFWFLFLDEVCWWFCALNVDA